VPQIRAAEKINQATISQIVPRQFQVLNIDQEVHSGYAVKIGCGEGRHILGLECSYVSPQVEWAYFVNDPIFQFTIKQEIQVYCQSFDVGVVIQNFFKKIIFVLVKKIERFFGNSDLSSPFEKLNWPQRHFF